MSLQRFRIVATYTGICAYEIYVRAIDGAGESSTHVLGADSLRTSQITVGGTPTILIPAALDDRQGLVIKHWSSAGDLYISEDSSKLIGQAYGLRPADALALDIAAGVTIYAQSSAGPIDVRIAEAGT